MSGRKSIARKRAENLTTCPSCGALPGEQCRARTRWSDRARHPHESRLALVNPNAGDPPLRTVSP